MAERARMIVRAAGGIPVIADADTGYGAPLNVVRTVQEYQAAGVAAIQLEDQAFPKKCGHLPDKELISAGEFIVKLDAALDARTDAGVVLIARTDARGPLGLDEAIRRGNLYADAGADVIFIEAPQSTAEIERIAAEVAAPKLINLVTGGLTPAVPAERLAQLGYSIAIYPTVPLRQTAVAMLTGLAELGGMDPAELIPSGPAGFFNLVGLAEWSDIGDRFHERPVGEQP
jgi:2-methylisocitrate lyase-like PEP mutase family enzyme